MPHIYPEGSWLFLTWNLHGSTSHAQFPPAHKLSAGQAFVWMDRCLDQAEAGPVFLRQEAIAQIVVTSLFKGLELKHYQLGPFVVMPNHVHVLLQPLISASLLLKSLKGFTAREANKVLNRTGESFWQRESYDHWVRDNQEWNKIAKYIEDNPVKAGLVVSAQNYRWSSANERYQDQIVRDFVHTSVNTARVGACATTLL